MSLSGEEIELLDAETPRSRRLQIRLKRLFRFIGTTGLLLLAVCLLGAVAAIVFFGLPFVAVLLFGGGLATVPAATYSLIMFATALIYIAVLRRRAI